MLASRIGGTCGPARWRAAVLALLVAASATVAEPAGTRALELTLEEAIRLALANNRSLERARLGREADKLSLEVAEERYRPQASVGASARTDNRRPGSMDLLAGPRIRVPTGGDFNLQWSEPVGGETDGSGTWTLGFSQPLLRGFGPAVDTAPVRLARIREKMNVLSFRDAVARTIESVIQAYRGVIRELRSIAISRGALDRARKQLRINRSLIRAGRMAEREIIQSEAEIANRELSLVEGENGLNSANASLLSILDLDGVSRVVPLDETLAAETSRPDPEQSIETAFANRTDYLGAQLRKEIATIELNRARNDQLWDLRLTADVSRGSGDGRDYGAVLELSIPLGERTSRTLALMQAKHALRDAEIALVELRQSIQADVRQAVHDVEVGLRRIELARRVRELAEEQLEVERSKLTQGLTSAYQLTAVEDGLVRAQNGELGAIVSYFNTVVSLDRTLGTTLRSWGIEVEEIESGVGDFRVGGVGQDTGTGTGQGTGRREIRLETPGPAAGHRGVAASDADRSRDDWTEFDPPRRAVEAAERVLAAARAAAGSGPRTGDPARQRRSLLLSLGEFEPWVIAAREVPPAAAGVRGPLAGTPERIDPHDDVWTLVLRTAFGLRGEDQ